MNRCVLYISWGSLSDKDMIEVMERNALRVIRLDWQPSDYDHDRDFEEKVLSVLRGREKADFVFSFNFLPIISRLCQRVKIFYISYIYDSPHLTLYSKTVANDKNLIFHFDKTEAQRLKNKGCPHVFHMPLGVNTERLKAQFMQSSCSKYQSDISFLGTLYTEENFFDSISYLPPELKGFLSGLMSVQKLVYGQDVITPCLSKERMDEIGKYAKFSLGENYEEDPVRIFADMFLLRKVTSMERIEIMERLFGEFSDVKLYTGSDVKAYPKLISQGRADYEKEMPKIFHNCRINLNISLRTIQSGIPLRIMDIMASGGFVLTNYQPEMAEYFVPGQDFDFYEDIPDLIKKCHYYLKHEKEREIIAENGMNKVIKEHSMDLKLANILNVWEDLREG